VGAAGLTQIMPSTARSLGMKDIFSPSYFKEAGSLLGRERKLKSKAKALFRKITESNSAGSARKARSLMQESLACRKKRKELYARYKQELLKSGADERLNPQKAAQYGLKYFSQMMKIQKGDMSLALASYNAGPHRIKQYRGIPPYEETIGYRNKVLTYYQKYLARAKKNSSKQAKKQEGPS
jgi:soluble lytic murein transglycosylase-like protein